MTDAQVLENNDLTSITVYEKKWLELLAEAQAIEIVTMDDVASATDLIKKCNENMKEVEDQRFSITKPMNDLISSIIQKAKDIMKPAQDWKVIIQDKILEYNKKIAQIQKEAQEKLRKEAEEEERKRKEEEAKRIAEEEEKRKEEEERLKNIEDPEDIKQIEEDRIRREFEIQKQKEIQEAEAKRIDDENKMKQEALLQNASTSKIKWLRDVWMFEVTDPTLVPRWFCSPDDAKIRDAIKIAKTREIPGVKIYMEKKIW